VARGDDLVALLDKREDARLEARIGGEQGGVPGRAMPEAEVLPTATRTAPSRSTRTRSMNSAGVCSANP
jgi:hypothetical protein